MINRFKFIVRETLSVAFWVYLITKLFIIDFDIYLLETLSPKYSFLLYYKYFLFIPALSFYWYAAGGKKLFKNICYVTFYPFIIFCWRIPKTLFQRKNWILIFIYSNSAILIAKSFKKNLFLLSLFSLAALIIIKATNTYLIGIAVIVLMFILLNHYYEKFYFAFNPTRAFALNSKTVWKNLKEKGITQFLPSKVDNEKEENKNVDKNTDEDNKNDLVQLVLYNSFFEFISSKLRKFQRTEVYIVFFVFGLAFTLLFTSTILAFINYSFFKIDPSNFSLNDKPSFFLFFYYSFNTIFSNQIFEIIPSASITRFLNMSGIFLGVLIVAIFATVYFNTKSQRYKEELDEIILNAREQGNNIETYINEEYSLSMEQAFEEVQNIQNAFKRLIFHLRNSTK